MNRNPSTLRSSLREFSEACLRLVKNLISVVRPARFYVRQALHDGGVQCGQAALLVLHQAQSVAHDFAGVVVAPAGELALDEGLLVLSERVAAGHII